MGSLVGHKSWIWSLCALSNKILASGSEDNIIKIWDTEERTRISTLSGHTNIVTALCYVRGGMFVSGSDDKSLIIWRKSIPQGSTPSIYSHYYILTGHKSPIMGIIRMNNTEIVSGEYSGNLRIWNIDQGLCVRHMTNLDANFLLMRQHLGGELAVNYYNKVKVWGAANNWEIPLKEFSVCDGVSMEFLSGDLLLRGGYKGELEFIDYGGLGCELPPTIQQLHSRPIYSLQRIVKNIVATASDDGYLKVIDPISRKCYLKFKKGNGWFSVITNFY